MGRSYRPSTRNVCEYSFLHMCWFYFNTILLNVVGLFHRAISQSGSALASWALTAPQQARERAYALGVITGCSSTSSKALLECLKELSAEEFVTAYKKFFVSNKRID